MTSGHAFYSPLAADVAGALNWNFFAAGNVFAGFETVTPVETIAALWRLASSPDATLESVVASIPLRGAEAVKSFAVVVVSTRVAVVLRGAGSVDIVTAAGGRRIDSRDMQPWYLAEFDGVTGLSLGSAERPAGIDTVPSSRDLPVLSGLVRAPWLAWTSSSGERAPAAIPPAFPQANAATPMDSRIPAHQPSSPITGSIPVQKMAAAPGPYRSAITTPIPVIPAAETTAELPPLPHAPAVPTPRSPMGGSSSIEDTIRGVGTGQWSLLGEQEAAETGFAAAATRSTTAAEGAPDDDLGDLNDTIVTERRRHRADGPTLTSWSPARLEHDPRFAAGAGREQRTGYYCFRIGDGQVYRLDTPVYIGRKPSSPRIVTGTIPRLLKVGSPSMEVSGTHVELRQDGGSVVVTDMRSTNGTFVSQPGVPHVKLRQGESLVVTPGTLVDIGDGNVIEILPIR